MKFSLEINATDEVVRDRLETFLKRSKDGEGSGPRLEGVVTWNGFAFVAPRTVLWDAVECRGDFHEDHGVVRFEACVEFHTFPVSPMFPVALGAIGFLAVRMWLGDDPVLETVRNTVGFLLVAGQLGLILHAAGTLKKVVSDAVTNA